jgi:nitrate reductase NapE component
MRIDPVKAEETDVYYELKPVEKISRRVAIVVAFVGVFVWFFKVIFGWP